MGVMRLCNGSVRRQKEMENSLEAVKESLGAISVASEENAKGICTTVESVNTVQSDMDVLLNAVTDCEHQTAVVITEVNKFTV